MLMVQTWQESVLTYHARSLRPIDETLVTGDIIAFGGSWVVAKRPPTTEVVDLASGAVRI